MDNPTSKGILAAETTSDKLISPGKADDRCTWHPFKEMTNHVIHGDMESGS